MCRHLHPPCVSSTYLRNLKKFWGPEVSDPSCTHGREVVPRDAAASFLIPIPPGTNGSMRRCLAPAQCRVTPEVASEGTGRRSSAGIVQCVKGLSNRLPLLSMKNPLLARWESLLCLLSVYSCVTVPLFLVFHETRFVGHITVFVLIDVIFVVDVLCIKTHTKFLEMGEEVDDREAVARHYFHSWFKIDLISAFPFDKIIVGCASAAGVSSSTVDALQWFGLLRLLRLTRVRRKIMRMTGANIVRVFQLLLYFLMFAHWLGLLWYTIAIKPLEESDTPPPSGEWMWDEDGDSAYRVATRYVCSLYWALSVMTSLKGKLRSL